MYASVCVKVKAILNTARQSCRLLSNCSKSLKLLLYTGFLTPLSPLHLAPLSVFMVECALQKLYLQEILPILIIVLTLARFTVLVPILTLLATIVLCIASRRSRWFITGSLALQLFSILCIHEGVVGLHAFIIELKTWAIGSSSNLTPFYTVLLFTLAFIDYFKLVHARFSSGGFFAEAPERVPVVMFMLLLCIAVALLGMDRRGLANKVAELAYYFLMVGVLMAFKSVCSNGGGGDEG